RTLLALDPESPAIRAFLFQHLAMTMARKAASDPERREWIREGLQIVDEGLALDPESFDLQRAKGLAFFIRTENPDPAFTQVCTQEYHDPPVRLAPACFESALNTRDDMNTRLFLIASLWNAARFEMREKRFTSASEFWKKSLADLPLWLDLMEEPQARNDLEAYYRDLEAYCTLMGQSTNQMEENQAARGKTMKKLKERIMANPYCELSDELDP
ncbi:MAG: hypothetical protein ABIK28_00470, partial [Planctomycetota bacterium]